MLETMRISLDALRAHKLRSFLTFARRHPGGSYARFCDERHRWAEHVRRRPRGKSGRETSTSSHRFGIITSEDAWIKAQKRAARYHGGIRTAPRQT